jgi:hypothetical protein
MYNLVFVVWRRRPAERQRSGHPSPTRRSSFWFWLDDYSNRTCKTYAYLATTTSRDP